MGQLHLPDDWTKFTHAVMSHEWIALFVVSWFAAIGLYAILQVWFGLAWTGRWRIAAFVPLIFPAVLALLFSVLQSGNPEVYGPRMEILDNLIVAFFFASPVGFIYLVIAGIVHRRRRVHTTVHAS